MLTKRDLHAALNDADYNAQEVPFENSFYGGGGGVISMSPEAIRSMLEQSPFSGMVNPRQQAKDPYSPSSGSLVNDTLRDMGTYQTKPDTPEKQAALAQAFPQGGGGPQSVARIAGTPGATSKQLVPTSSVTTTSSTWEPTKPRPELGALPEYSAPEYDEKKVRQISQRIAAPALMRLRRDMMTTIAQSGNYFGNPIARAEATRRALRAYGLGVAETLGRSEQAGRAQYSQEYATNVNEAMTNYNAQMQDRMTKYTAAMDEFVRTGTQKSTSTTKKEYATQYGNTLQGLNQQDPGTVKQYANRPAGYRTYNNTLNTNIYNSTVPLMGRARI